MFINLISTFLLASSFNVINADACYKNLSKSFSSELSYNYAINNNFQEPNLDQNIVKDLNGDIFIVQTGKEKGTMIIDSISLFYIESSVEMICPYIFSSLYDNYYFGPWCYFYRINDIFYHCLNENINMTLENANELQTDFNTKLDEFRSLTSDEAFNNYLSDNKPLTNIKYKVNLNNKTYINNYEYIKEANLPKNDNNSCGFIAAFNILNYYDKTISNGIINKQFKDSEGNLYHSKDYEPSKSLRDKLIEYNNGETESWAYSVAKSVNKYCEEYNVAGKADWFLFLNGVDRSLFEERPFILFGNVPNPSKDNSWKNRINHAVTCYGFDKTWWGGYYIVNYGWSKEYSEVSLGFSFIGSSMTFKINESNYLKEYTIKTNEYGFPDSYNSNIITSSIKTSEDLYFYTARYRCGFIHNEYLTLSARKEDFDTAYIEYKFINPIKSMKVNLSYWSVNEGFEPPNIYDILFECKKLYSNNYDYSISLKEINLSKDRKIQTTLEFNFPYKTREFRFYIHYDLVSGLKDRNKGRISIGDITINSYK